MNDDITAHIEMESTAIQAVVTDEKFAKAVIAPAVLIPQSEPPLPDMLLIYQIAKT